MSEFESLPAGLPRLINDRYEIDSLIGRGGMADVYLATDHVLSRKVAVKVVRHDTASNPMVVSRFRREAKSVAGLSHPNIVAVYDTGDLPAVEPGKEALPFMVMEYVTGRTLRQIIADDNVDETYAVSVMRGVCDALDHSHSKHIVHRDIKPANVMVTDAGHVKLMDFGIAQALDNSETMTQTAAVVGTAQYFSPEQARGEQVDFRSDIYSAGCLFYELLTHKPPFTGDSPVSVAYQHVGESPVPPSEVDPELNPIYDAVVLKALAKERDERFQSAGSFATALDEAQRGIEYQENQLPTYTMPIYGTHDSTDQVFGSDAAPLTSEHPVFSSRSEEFANAPRQHKSNTGLIVLLTIVALLAVGIASFLVIRYVQTEQEKNAPVAIPSVLNLSEADATRLLRDAELKVNVQHEFSDDVDQDLATRTDPDTGTELSKESTVTLYISDGSEQRTIPDNLINQSETTVREALDAAGLEVGEVSRENSATIPTDWSIGTTPEGGAKVKAGSKVDLILSTGKVKVPTVTNMTKEEATKALEAEDVGLHVQFNDVQTDEHDPGNLFEQDQPAGTDVAQGSLIKISVATAPPEPTPTPEPTPSETPESSESATPEESQESPDDEDSEDSEESATANRSGGRTDRERPTSGPGRNN